MRPSRRRRRARSTRRDIRYWCGAIPKAPLNARYYGYEQKAISTQFAHYTDISLSDRTNSGMAGDAAGEVSDEYVDKRGIYVPLQLSIPDGGLNAGLRAVKDVSQVSLDIHFRVIFRASLNAALLSGSLR